MITKLQITGKLHYHRKCDFQLSKRKLGYRALLPLTAPIPTWPIPAQSDSAFDVPSHVLSIGRASNWLGLVRVKFASLCRQPPSLHASHFPDNVCLSFAFILMPFFSLGTH